MTDDRKLSREAFLHAGVSQMGRMLGGILGWSQESPTAFKTSKSVFRPPGAVPEERFLALCTRCDACVGACPHHAIKVATRIDGIAEGTPFMHDLRSSPCLLCPDTPCITACERGALRQIDGIRIARAHVEPDRCHAFQDKACTICLDACPLGETAMLKSADLPVKVLAGCTGCGQCLAPCPADPPAIALRSLA